MRLAIDKTPKLLNFVILTVLERYMKKTERARIEIRPKLGCNKA